MYNTTGRQIYYQYGMLNECHRMCLEQGVEQGWSVELLQYLARCSMLGGETNAAQKYLRLLRQTQFYGPWADHMEQLLANRKQMGEDRETGPITHMLHYLNNKGADNGFVEQYLMQQLSVNDSDDPYFQEQAVLGAMWMRSPDDFWPRFMRYLELRPEQKIPRIIQEAVWLFGNMQEKEIIFSLPIDQSVKGLLRCLLGYVVEIRRTGWSRTPWRTLFPLWQYLLLRILFPQRYYLFLIYEESFPNHSCFYHTDGLRQQAAYGVQ